MRPIKFRAWDKINKKMFRLSHNPISELSKASIPIMQFTGLKDKNGKEIYEGDIMKNYDYHFFVVEWNKKNARWDNCFGREVIGNIYENPELIKEIERKE